MPLTSLPAVFMRGGTSKAVVFRRQDLPADEGLWPAIFLSAMGSPDPYGRQLDGMGGGLYSLSKVCVVGPSQRRDADVDYLFAQVSVDRPVVDLAGNCGNMSSAVGPFAVDEGIVAAPRDGETTVRIFNSNTRKLILARFAVAGGRSVTEGDCRLEGVAGTGAPIRLEFLDPGGSKCGSLLPSGRTRDRLRLRDGRAVDASLVDAGNPCAFVAAASLGLTGRELPAALEARPDAMAALEELRIAASQAMGLAATPEEAASLESIPKIALVAAPEDQGADISVRMLPMGRPHRAVPVTGALCLAVALRLAGSVPDEVAGVGSQQRPLRIAHPSGVTAVDARVETDGGRAVARAAAVYRTARRLFDGRVYYHAA